MKQNPMNKSVSKLKMFLASYNDNIGHFSAGYRPNSFKQASWSLGGLWPTQHKQPITYLHAFSEKKNSNHFLLSTCWFKEIYKNYKGVTLQKTLCWLLQRFTETVGARWSIREGFNLMWLEYIL